MTADGFLAEDTVFLLDEGVFATTSLLEPTLGVTEAESP
jgi:hypothetical protein